MVYATWASIEKNEQNRHRTSVIRRHPTPTLPRKARERKGSGASLHQRAAAIRERAERLVGGNGRDELVIIVGVFRFFRLLHLEQIHRVNDAAVLANGDVAEQLV